MHHLRCDLEAVPPLVIGIAKTKNILSKLSV